MPLTQFQATVAKALSVNRSEDSYLAGGAALHFLSNSVRYSNDLDYFNDSVERVALAFQKDQNVLESSGYAVQVEMSQPGYIRATVRKEGEQTKIEWAHDSAWRFMPTVYDEAVGYMLHPVDLAINKVLALAGRSEPRDLLDVLFAHKTILPLGALIWAAAGKDPGFTPNSIIEILKRRGKYRDEDFRGLNLAEPIDLQKLKQEWLEILTKSEEFINSRPSAEIGCLYYSPDQKIFIAPTRSDAYQLHYGKPGGVLPTIVPY